MRFLVDMPLSAEIAEWLRQQGHDATHLRDEGLQRLGDQGIFTKAAEEKRVVVTADLDFGRIAASSRRRTPSVVLFRIQDTRAATVILRLQRVLAVVSRDLVAGAIVVVEEERYRVRRLPLGS